MPGPVLTRRLALGLGGMVALGACSRGGLVAEGRSRGTTSTPKVVGDPRTAGELVPEIEVLDRTRDGLVERWTLLSSAVPRPVTVAVLLPRDYDTALRRRYPVVVLLHGSGGDEDSWLQLGLPDIAAGTDAIYVMPDGGHQGWYLDWAQPSPPVHWESLHVLAMIPAIDDVYRTVARRSGRAVCGISMGGFGAVHYAQAYPDLFAAVTAYSGAVSLRTPRDLAAMDAQQIDDKPPFAIFGREDMDARVARVDPVLHVEALRGMRVRLYCGDSADDSTEAAMRAANEELAGRARRVGIDVGLDVRPGGHEPATWRPALQADLPGLLRFLDPAR